jgi:hypothetical protein
VYGPYNDMLGEFYDRSLVFLDALRETQNWVVDGTQLYLHLYRPYKPLLDSHHLFTSPYRSKPLLSVVELLDDATCQCLSRLILCGYDVRNATAADVTVAATSAAGGGGPAAATTTNSTPDAADATAVLVRPGEGWDSQWKTRYKSDRFRMVRDRLRSTLVDKNPHVQQDIEKFRNMQFDRLNIFRRDRPKYRLVGLAQRNGRRRWRDLSALQALVQEQLMWDSKYIALVEMNVEVDSSSYQQLVRHAALDGLIGIHGAQLAEAVWMKDGSWVVELLPFVPQYVYMGHWTRTVHEPTPVGVMFHQTGLNHAGYRIPVELTPYCNHNVSDEFCWKENMWDGRDFTLTAPVLTQMLDAFFPPSPSTSSGARSRTGSTDAVATWPANATGPVAPRLCSDLQNRSNGTLVLYNVHCADVAGGPARLRHYYWPCDFNC